jgi:hypothetical protein
MPYDSTVQIFSRRSLSDYQMSYIEEGQTYNTMTKTKKQHTMFNKTLRTLSILIGFQYDWLTAEI